GPAVSPSAQRILNRDQGEEFEAIAMANLRSIHKAEAKYAAVHDGRYGTLQDLISEELLDRRFRDVISGYTFQIEVSGANNDSYVANAAPDGPPARYGFKSGIDSIIRYASGPPGTPIDQPVLNHKL